jgi:hypothetical protein
MRETYEKRIEIIFIRTILQKSFEMPAYEYRTSGVPLAYLARVCIEYAYRIKHTSEYAQNLLEKMFLSRRMPAYATVLETYTTYA